MLSPLAGQPRCRVELVAGKVEDVGRGASALRAVLLEGQRRAQWL